MATAAPSPLASSAEKTNGAKLSRLLIDGGTTVLRNAFDNYHPPANLAADLNANYSILKTLLKKRVLRKPQWDKLFPPGGVAPDSNTFDITLLFLLLTNICGLSPPHSGWHTKPPPSDTSVEANLARIKFLRNELYGHVSSTGVDTPSFTVLWQEISAVLVSLGLDQTEIDRLDAEHCGEDDYLDVLLDWADSEEDLKSQLKDIHHCQTETQQDVEKILKTQLEDRKTRQDSISKLEGVSLTQTKTCQAVEEVHGTLQAGLQDVKQEFENLTIKREIDRADEVLRKLAKSEFKGDIEYHAEKFQEGTREWIFKNVEDWLDDRSSTNRVMVISGNAGMGKSVISAVICKRMQEAGRLSGSHFCQHNNVRCRKPQLMLQSLACHLSQALPKYKNALVEQLSRNLGVELNSMGVEELFALLFKEPLSTATDPGRNILIVIDGLDESEYQGRNDLLDVIANHFCKLPQWIRFFVTTRSEINIADSLKHLQPLQLEENQEENLRDIQLFFEMQLNHAIEEKHKDKLLRKLVEKSEGIFLYAYFLTDFIQKNVTLLTLAQLENNLPLGISSVYLSHFKRLENELCKELKIEEEQVLRFLCALTASREPLPVAFVSRILIPSERSLAAQRRVNKVISCISTLLPVRDGRLHFFHKSVKDWLTNTSYYGQHDFTVDEKEGHEILFNLCTTELDSIKRKGVQDTQFSDTQKYALQHGVQHMIEVGEFGERSRLCNSGELVDTCRYVTDLELIYAKLCVSTTSCLEELFSVHANASKGCVMTEESRVLLEALFLLVRKHSYILRDCPHLFFQCLINEGGPELSKRAANILETKLPDLQYMSYLDKEDLPQRLGAVQARFYCSDTVVCFDVSPQMDYMVCECRDGTLHLWSLQTGNSEWVRSSLVKKEFYGDFDEPFGSAFRMVKNSLSYYRSVLFHPTGNFVLPGSLRTVYSLSGDVISLFQESTCTFSNCFFSGDKKRLLTDSPNNTKEIVLWSMENGDELKRIIWIEEISCFAISQDGSLIAISDFTGCIFMFYVEDEGITALIKDTDAVCGLMSFTSDDNTLVCGFLCLSFPGSYFFRNNPRFVFLTPSKGNDSLSVHQQNYVLWPCQSSTLTDSDFLGQTVSSCWFKKVHSIIPNLSAGMYCMLNNNKALLGSPTLKFLSVVNIGVLNEIHNLSSPSEERKVKEIIFSQKEDTIYFISGSTKKFSSKPQETHVAVFDTSSRRITTIRNVPSCKIRLSDLSSVFLFPMKEGVILFTNREVPELWNFDLTECIRPLSSLKNIKELIPVSDELIACKRDILECHVTIDIVNITSGELISSVKTKESQDPFSVLSICCNSQQQVLISTYQVMTSNPTELDIIQITVSLWNTDSSLMWEQNSGWVIMESNSGGLTFSPHDEFVVAWNCLDLGHGVHVLDAKTGAILHSLLQISPRPSSLFSPNNAENDIVDCKFVANGESLVCCSEDNFLRLFNVRSGDLLSVLDIGERPFSLGACLGSSLVVIGLSGDRLKFIHVELPRVKDVEESKGLMTKRK